jgi:hypothetical protein
LPRTVALALAIALNVALALFVLAKTGLVSTNPSA